MTEAAARQEILLESGTNEMEIMEFYLGTQSFGINVHKLREIIPFDQSRVTVLPDSMPSVIGTFLVRGRTIPLIDLNLHLRRTPDTEPDDEHRRIVLVCEFNNRVNGFLVDGVNQIHRVSWQNVQPLSSFIEQYRPRFTGSINVDKREILIIDLEHIIAEIDPEMDMAYDVTFESPQVEQEQELSLEERRGNVRLMLAEDSALIRAGILKVLTNAGYSQLTTFVDGQDCYEAIARLQQKVSASGEAFGDQLRLVISDIEMPKMDGLTLCRKIKEDMGLKEVTVLMFSSLINEQMALKCDAVGADGYVTKPQIPELVEMIDSFCLKG